MAEGHAVDVFARNLRSLLLQPPIAKQVVLAIDPGFRTGCKVAVLDGQGDLLEHGVIHPHPPQNRRHEAKLNLKNLVRKHEVGVVAIGNGTACRETEELVAEIIAEGTQFHQHPVGRPPSAEAAKPPGASRPPAPEPTPRPPRPAPGEGRCRARTGRRPPRALTARPAPRAEGGARTRSPRERGAPAPRRPRRRSRRCRRSSAGPRRGSTEATPRRPPAPSSAGEAASGEAGRRASEALESSESTRNPAEEGDAGDLAAATPRRRRTGLRPSRRPPRHRPRDRPTPAAAPAAETAESIGLAGSPTPCRRRPPHTPPRHRPRPRPTPPGDPERPTTRSERGDDRSAGRPPGRSSSHATIRDAPAATAQAAPAPARAASGRRPPAELAYVIVNEAGASVYSASPVGREEFPDFDATLRGTISIGRRLQDPLSELVKIDPQNIGVGLYQHDVNPKQLKESLEAVIESCVNYVGVDLNTASVPLLRHVSGLNQLAARGWSSTGSSTARSAAASS